MKNHLKRIAAPRTWSIARKDYKYSIRPNAGAHSFDMGLPLAIILRDYLGLAKTLREAKRILQDNELLIDGNTKKDTHMIVGLFDVISIPSMKKYYRLGMDRKGRLSIINIPEKESTFKICKVINKTMLNGGKLQLNLHDGKNILSDSKVNVGDSLLIELPTLKIKEILPLKEGVQIFLTKGKHGGSFGSLVNIKDKTLTYKSNDLEIKTTKKHVYVIGNDKQLITVRGEQ